jgi:aminopeptidase N
MQELQDSFGKTKFYGVEFANSVPISTYIYSLVAGPFYEFTPDEEFKVPLRLLCRSSLKDHVEKIA